jgi:hypothetical protein
MLERIRYMIWVFWRRLIKRDLQRADFAIIADQDNEYQIPADYEDIFSGFSPDTDYRDYRNQDEYNRDFLAIFKTCRRNILLDYSQKDGHFRV